MKASENLNLLGKTILLFLLLCCTFGLIGCGYTPEEIATINSYKTQGERNAINYIQQKYGFIPNVAGVENQYGEGGPIPDFTPMPNGSVLVTMNYNGKEFKVEITGEQESLDGADDYQKEEILIYLNDHIKENYPMVEEAAFYSFEKDDHFFSPLFTGDNFYDYVKDSYVVLKLCNKQVTDFPLNAFVSEVQCESVNIIDYKDKEKMPLMFNSGICTSSKGPDMDTILPYIDQYLYYDRFNTEEPFVKNVCTKYDKDIVVCTLEDEKVIVGEEKKTVADFVKRIGLRYVSSYKIQSNAEEVYVYIPHNMVKDKEKIVVYAGKYENLSYESLDYTYFDNSVIKNDHNGFETSFTFKIYAKKDK